MCDQQCAHREGVTAVTYTHLIARQRLAHRRERRRHAAARARSERSAVGTHVAASDAHFVCACAHVIKQRAHTRPHDHSQPPLYVYGPLVAPHALHAAFCVQLLHGNASHDDAAGEGHCDTW
jgi:hypothetical protein